MARIIRVDVVSDNICPWCYVGKRRLEKAIAAFSKKGAGDVGFEVHWHPFFLDPTLPAEGVDKLARYKAKFGEARMAQMLPYMAQIGSAEGITFSYGGKMANTLNSHRLVEWATEQGGLKAQDSVISSLFEAYFEKEKNIGDTAVLKAAAAAAGLDADAASAFLESDDGKERVLEQVQSYMRKYRISGVPFFIVQLQTSEAAAPEAVAVTAPGSDAAPVCADGVCELPSSTSTAPASAGNSGSRKAASNAYTASGAQDVEYLQMLFEQVLEEGESGDAR